MRRRLIGRWEFALAEPDKKPSAWRTVKVPHDWLIYDTKNLYRDGDGYYRCEIPSSSKETRVGVRFEGVYQDCDVFFDGEKIFEWKYGYTTFDVPIPDSGGKTGELMVLVRHRHPNSRWYSGAGIYRRVWLIEKGESELVPDGVYVVPKKTAGGYITEIDAEVRGKGEAVLSHRIFDESGALMAEARTAVTLFDAAKNVETRLPEFSPLEWSPEEPRLYTLKTELLIGGEAVDWVEQKIGYKTLEFSPSEGLRLNGLPYKLKGTCIHHDMGALGAAVNRTAIRRQLEILKEMGVNAVRTSHNPPAVEFLDLCDEMGFLVDNECFDMWERPKNRYDYHRFFPEWHERDVASWVRRDRSRACMLMWSIGNEISDTGFLPRGVEVTRELKRCVRLHDYKNLYSVTLGSNTMYTEGGQECAKELDVVGYNYLERIYDEHHEKYPDWVIYGSETSSTYQSRGVYHFPASTVTSTYDDEQCSSLLNCATSYGAINSEYNITIDRVKKYSLGQFIWTALDYIGEPTPFHTKNSHFGHVDTAGFPKDTFYAYKAEWNLGGEPFVHLYPHWDWNEGQMIDLFIFSNCFESELWVNGECLGRHRHDHEGFGALSGRWRVPYRRGEIMAIGYDECGNEVARAVRRSFGDPAKISLKPDRTELRGDGEDLIYVEIGMLDGGGNPVENARNRVNIEVSGQGKLVGLDNGDSTDYDEYKGTSRRLFNGKLLAIVASDPGAEGDICLTARSEGLPGERLTLKCVKAEPAEEYFSNYLNEANRESEPDGEIPVRKIELTLTRNRLTPAFPEAAAKAKILPENSTFNLDDVEFKATSDSGVVTNLARVEFKNGEAIVRAAGDGDFRLRAYCKNGTPYEAVLSELEMSCSGFGQAGFDPYGGIVSASLCSSSGEKLQVVMGGGLQVPKEGALIRFDGVNFGRCGAEELTVGIFSYSSEPIPFELWEGEKILGKFVYRAQSRWNTYQYNTFRLSETLCGVHDLAFKFSESLRFEGFGFKKPEAVGRFIPACRRARVFGDSFREQDSAILGIGNNVTVVFEDIELSRKAEFIEISGMTRNAAESVRIVVKSEAGENVYTVEFDGKEGQSRQKFGISAEGRTEITLLFLPGCDFDLDGITIY